MSSSKDLSIVQGDKLSATIQFSPPEDITGHTFSFSLRMVGEDTASYYDTTSGFAITNGTGGTVTLTIGTATTQSWTPGTYAYQIRDESNGSEGVVSKGRLTVLPCFSL
jgi:hypothetical protein